MSAPRGGVLRDRGDGADTLEAVAMAAVVSLLLLRRGRPAASADETGAGRQARWRRREREKGFGTAHSWRRRGDGKGTDA